MLEKKKDQETHHKSITLDLFFFFLVNNIFYIVFMFMLQYIGFAICQLHSKLVFAISGLEF